MFSCRVDLLGQPGFWRADSTFAPLERRLALALAYLALEGPTCRAELAALLWPESGERQRNDSLRQLLFKLRRLLGAGVLVERARVLSLSDALTVDAVRVRAASRGRHWADVVAARPHLLEGVREDGDSELGTWLARQRAGFVFRHAAALGQEAARLDEEGQPAEAVKLASARLQLDPYSDEACCQVLGLLLRLGDRPESERLDAEGAFVAPPEPPPAPPSQSPAPGSSAAPSGSAGPSAAPNASPSATPASPAASPSPSAAPS